MCYAYGADLKNSRVKLHLNIDGHFFAHFQVAEAALDLHADFVHLTTKLKSYSRCVCVRNSVLFERSV